MFRAEYVDDHRLLPLAIVLQDGSTMQRFVARTAGAWHDRPRPTLFGRALLLLSAELLVNGALWAAAGVIFARDPATRPVLGLALLAWVRTVTGSCPVRN